MTDALPLTAFLLIGASALLLAIGVVPVMRRVALQTGTVDKPAARKIHSSPVPLLGGAAIYLAFILVLIFFGDRDYINEVVGIFVGASLMSFMGVVDDRWGLGSYAKLGGQMLAAGILVYTGVKVQLFGGWLDVAVTLLWVVGITNALNLLDNMDGLSGGVAMIAAIFFTLLAAMSKQYLVGALAAALAGACAGFLIYNWNPAHIFMGDAGSLFLGFMLAAVAIKLRFPTNSTTVTWMIPLLVLGLPIFDTTLVFISRLRRGKNPLTTPGKDHVSHRLAFLLGSRREAVLVCYLICCAFGVAAIFVSQASFNEAFVVAMSVTGLCAYTLWRLEFRRGGVRPQ
ncbi:MAG: undecaprenyl-phosphate alpha-N-acetylglucosaminyl 1-phosphate transferase [Chloroflexota bacterium]|jgi:UDP-GlcNAc:undecaprenyl-phosphate GlcNAc-1-phosphate transferase|nr:undecaprenyl/decaprenyl-phosphate alpha-N-acetylglucosaminyl 1-phosphate transferase [Caldilinea sp.]GIK75405.1 MAG: undecaprenyl-phosphate alpha-N-acetylglucosaminyl 1-phosphate transferase [Chloroflexota bacterium]